MAAIRAGTGTAPKRVRRTAAGATLVVQKAEYDWPDPLGVPRFPAGQPSGLTDDNPFPIAP